MPISEQFAQKEHIPAKTDRNPVENINNGMIRTIKS